MTSPTHSLQNVYLASSRRPIQLRMRTDLLCQRQNYMGRRYWVVKDPLTLEYFRFEEEEYFLLQSLDGSSSLEQLQQQFESEFAPQKITFAELHRFLGMVHKSCLATSSAPDQGVALQQRSREKQRRRRWQALTNVLSYRFRGIDPDRMLDRVYRYTGALFSLPAVITVMLLAVSALLLVATQYDTFARRLPHFHEFFAVQNWFALAATLAITKILHEFGHGLACKRFGGECHEMGIMLLVFTPCLYCNVSDSWMLNNRWHRAGIAAAGMYVELFLAAIATWVWWYSVPGVVHYLALNVMFVCSVSTLLFNANPLMRYDGYYILSDLSEIPNLRQKATKIVHEWAASWSLGIPPSHDPFLPHRNRWLFSIYSVAAVLYRWFITFSILWFVHHLLKPYGLQFIAHLIGAMSLFGLLVHPLWKLSRFLTEGLKMGRIQVTRLATTTLVAISLVALLFVPLPYHVECEVHVELRDDAPVYVEVAGALEKILESPGADVQRGTPIAVLDNSAIRLELIQLQARENLLREQWNTLRQRALADQLAAARMAEVATELRNIVEQIEQRRVEQQRLTLVAPRSGKLFPVAHRPKGDDHSVLPQWTGQPLDTNNLGAHLHKGVKMATVGDPERLQAILVIDQSDVPFVFAGQELEIILNQYPTSVIYSKIEVLGRRKAGRQQSDSKNRSTVADEQDVTPNGPSATRYFASAPLDLNRFVAPGGTGIGRIAVGKRSLIGRAGRAFSKTFRFDF